MAGKGSRPGEVALAHNGVLLLDEITEFSKQTLEATAEALKTWRPARVIAATNPCPCGFFAPKCACPPERAKAYLDRAKKHAAIVGITDVYNMAGRVENV
jgi:magnesium chelatase family protein